MNDCRLNLYLKKGYHDSYRHQNKTKKFKLNKVSSKKMTGREIGPGSKDLETIRR